MSQLLYGRMLGMLAGDRVVNCRAAGHTSGMGKTSSDILVSITGACAGFDELDPAAVRNVVPI